MQLTRMPKATIGAKHREGTWQDKECLKSPAIEKPAACRRADTAYLRIGVDARRERVLLDAAQHISRRWPSGVKEQQLQAV